MGRKLNRHIIHQYQVYKEYTSKMKPFVCVLCDTWPVSGKGFHSRLCEKETFSALLALCAGNSPVTDELPAQRPVTRSFDVFFYLRPNKRLSKQSRGWWFETPSRSLWRHCNGVIQTKLTTTKLCVYTVHTKHTYNSRYGMHQYIDGLAQERRNSSALAMELRLSCINPSIWNSGEKIV